MAGDKPKDALVKTKGKNTFTTLLFMYKVTQATRENACINTY